ncbi:hypothetical protein C0J52_14223 [Blattella germanica]|nr:hypothetical protein C0J52_14223 [Blattella germanica]
MGTQNLTLNFNEICRLCLVKEGEMSSIFAVSLPKRIMSFVSFENSGIKEESDYEEGNKDICVKPENDDEDSCDDKHDTLKDVSYEDDDDDSCDNTDIPSLKVNREGYNEVVDGNVENQVPIVREERAGTSNSENIVILCNVETLPQRFAALQEPFGNDSSHKDDKKRRRRNNIQKPNRKTRLRRIPKNKKPTPALKSQSSQSLLICVKSEPKLIEEDDDILSEDKPPFICKICSKSFSKRDNLKKHEIIHRGEKPYLCEECGKSFARKQDLNVHRRYHSGVRPYACSLCDKTFHSYSGLKSHENRHNGIKPFLCNACGKTFVQKSQLTNHERVHTQVSNILILVVQ